jgi:uracil phosphoribosyltransferase
MNVETSPRFPSLIASVQCTSILLKLLYAVIFQLHYLRLPRDIKDYHVILMDATMATGAAAMMAIRVLLDHDVPEENILLLSLIMAVSGKRLHLIYAK